MDDRERSGDIFEGAYDKLESEEHVGIEDELPQYLDREKQQVTMSGVRLAFTANHHKLLAVSLALLAAVLLVVDIGLGVHYNKLTTGSPVMDIASEVAKLKKTYDQAVHKKEEVQKQLTKEKSEHQITKWELQHQTRSVKDYQTQIDKLQTEVSDLESHIPLIEDGCRHCFPGWTLWNSMCYYFAFSENLSSRSWPSARQFCNKYGAELVMLDSRMKQRRILEFLNQYQDPSRTFPRNGFWIGLTDAKLEGVWKWPNGTLLSEGFWREGEPNNKHNEDCAAMYPSLNPYQAWNDAPCSYSLKWICEMASTSMA